MRLTVAASLVASALIVVGGAAALLYYPKYQERTSRRECAEQIAQKKQEVKQARVAWEEQCKAATKYNSVTSAAGKALVESSCEGLYGEKPPEGSLTVDEERRLIKLCMERKGY